MIFALLVFLAAFSIEGIGSYISVVGLSALFASNPIIIVLAVTLDFAKVITVSFLYKYWSSINKLMKVYMTVAAAVLVTITSAGAFGFLSGEFQKAIADTGTQSIKIQSLEDEQGRLQKRKEEIDAQIAKVPDKNTRGRAQLIRQFGPESNRINDRLSQIDKELPDLKVKNVDKELHVGPIIYVAKAFNTTPEEAVKWVIQTIIFVFDPLAIALLIAGNFLLDLKKKVAGKSEPSQMIEHANIDDRGYSSTGEEETAASWNQICQDLASRKESPDIDLQPTEEDLKDFEVEAVEPTKIQQEIHLTELSLPEDPPHIHDPEFVNPWSKEKIEEFDKILDDLETPAEVHEHHTPSKKITIEERDGRDVISLKADVPQSSLEHVNDKTADVTLDDSQHSRHTMKLYSHYEDNFPEEPVKVG